MNIDSREMQSSVLILVYIETALYVNMRALGGSVIVSSSRLSAREFLKYVAWFCTIGWSCRSTHFPSA